MGGVLYFMRLYLFWDLIFMTCGLCVEQISHFGGMALLETVARV